MSCFEIITDYGLRSIGLGERLLPKTDFTICHQLTLIGSGMLWNIYFGTVALASGFVLATVSFGKGHKSFLSKKSLRMVYIRVQRLTPVHPIFLCLLFIFILKTKFHIFFPLNISMGWSLICSFLQYCSL